MTLFLENMAIELSLGNRGIPLVALHAIFLKIHDVIVGLVGVRDADADQIHMTRLNAAELVPGCPQGWSEDRKDGFFTPFRTLLGPQVGIPPKRVRIRPRV
jgi:hypothetical protein